MVHAEGAADARREVPQAPEVLGQRLKREWFPDVRADLLSGTVVALALIPEAVAFSIIAGVDPKVGLYASFIIAVLTGIFGGRTGMISAATAAMAVLFVTLVKNHGIQYLFAATILTGILQFGIGAAGFGRFMRFVPRAVMVGFVNALGDPHLLAQMPQFQGANWMMYAMVAASLGIIYGLPRITKAVPSALVAIIVMTIVAIALKLPIRTVGDMGELPKSLPFFALPQVPISFETLQIIFPYSVGLAIVGVLESLLTASLLDDLTETTSDKNRECKAQGLAQLRDGLLRRHGGLRHDRAVGDQLPLGRARALSSFRGGRALAVLHPCAGRVGAADSDGRAGRGDVYGVHRHLRLGRVQGACSSSPRASRSSWWRRCGRRLHAQPGDWCWCRHRLERAVLRAHGGQDGRG
jgi:SulP family sulfate permease